MFFALDTDHSGSVTFAELLKLMYPLAERSELAVMLSWSNAELESRQREAARLAAERQARAGKLTPEQATELKALFRPSRDSPPSSPRRVHSP